MEANQIDETRLMNIHAGMVARLKKNPADIVKELAENDKKADMWHMASALMGETGEAFDIVKKHVVYNKPWTDEMQEHLIEELGDIEFFLEGLRQAFGIERHVTLAANYLKLGKRYPGKGFSNKDAQERKDKKGD